MAFQGFALFALSAFSLASLLYYMYTYNATEEQSYGSGNCNNTYDTYFEKYSDFHQWSEPSSSGRRRTGRRRRQSKRSESTCTICLQKIEDKKIILPCHHQFHSNCIDDWKLRGPQDICDTCPNCRKRIPRENQRNRQ